MTSPVVAFPAPVPTGTTIMRTRAEERMHCPLCGQSGTLRRVGGGRATSRLVCRGYRYDPPRENECRFRFTLSDASLDRLSR